MKFLGKIDDLLVASNKLQESIAAKAHSRIKLHTSDIALQAKGLVQAFPAMDCFYPVMSKLVGSEFTKCMFKPDIRSTYSDSNEAELHCSCKVPVPQSCDYEITAAIYNQQHADNCCPDSVLAAKRFRNPNAVDNPLVTDDPDQKILSASACQYSGGKLCKKTMTGCKNDVTCVQQPVDNVEVKFSMALYDNLAGNNKFRQCCILNSHCSDAIKHIGVVNFPKPCKLTEARAAGDVYITTLDGKFYECHMTGDVLLLQAQDFMLQGRMKNVNTECENLIDGSYATNFVGFALTSELSNPNMTKISVLVGAAGSPSVLIQNGTSGEDIYLPNTGDTARISFGDMSAERLADGTVKISNSVIGATVIVEQKGLLSLNIEISLGEEYFFNQTIGLLGVLNGDISDDFTRSDGVVLPPTTIGRDLYYNFSKTFQITDDSVVKSLFYFDPGTSADDSLCDVEPLLGVYDDTVFNISESAILEGKWEASNSGSVEQCMVENEQFQHISYEENAQVGSDTEAFVEHKVLVSLPSLDFISPNQTAYKYDDGDQFVLHFMVNGTVEQSEISYNVLQSPDNSSSYKGNISDKMTVTVLTPRVSLSYGLLCGLELNELKFWLLHRS